MRLQQNLPRLRQRRLAVPVVLHAGVIDHQLVVQVDRGALADLDDAERVPLAERLVREDERVAARRVGRVVEQPAASRGAACGWGSSRRTSGSSPRFAPAACRAGRCRCRPSRRSCIRSAVRCRRSPCRWRGTRPLPSFTSSPFSTLQCFFASAVHSSTFFARLVGIELRDVGGRGALRVDGPPVPAGEVFAVEQRREPLRRVGGEDWEGEESESEGEEVAHEM